jgi:hypothetical protein
MLGGIVRDVIAAESVLCLHGVPHTLHECHTTMQRMWALQRALSSLTWERCGKLSEVLITWQSGE